MAGQLPTAKPTTRHSPAKTDITGVMSERVTTSAAQRPPALVEVNLKARRSEGTAFLIGLAAVAGVVAVSLVASPQDMSEGLFLLPLQLVFVCALMVLANRISVGRLRRRSAQFAEAGLHHPVADSLKRVLAEPSMLGSEERFKRYARALISLGRAGETIRNCPPKHVTPIDPITVPFEPHPLDEPDRWFGGQDDGLEDQPDADLLEPEALEQLRAEAVKRARNQPKAWRGMGWLGTALFVLPTTAFVMYAFSVGQVTWTAIFLCGVVLFALLGWGQATGVLKSVQCFVVPGGLAVRQAHLGSMKWKVHLFDRRNSVLIVHRVDYGRRTVFVADADTDRRLAVTPAEADFLLRAWLSPIPPPPPEQLTDLA